MWLFVLQASCMTGRADESNCLLPLKAFVFCPGLQASGQKWLNPLPKIISGRRSIFLNVFNL